MADAAEDFNREAVSVATLFAVAALNHDVTKIKNLIAEGHDVNALDGMGQSALHVACNAGSLEAVAALLDAGADKNAVSRIGMTPLAFAMTGSHNPIVRLLLERGADPDQLIDMDTSPLTLAVSGGDEEQARLLLMHKASQLPRPPSRDAAAITVAAGAGHLHLVRIMHEEFGAGLDVSSGVDGMTPLCAAIQHHQRGCFDYLLEKGADIHVLCGEKKLLSLDFAVGANNDWATEELLRRGMAVDGLPNEQGATTLMTAALGGAAKSAQVLLKHGADIEAQMKDGSTARRIAEMQGHPVVVALIDDEKRRRHLKAVEKDAENAHGGLAASTKVLRPLSFRKPQSL